MQRPLHLYDLRPLSLPRWIPGDQYPRALARALLRPFRGTPPVGLGKITQNLVLGLERLGTPYQLWHGLAPAPAGSPVAILHGPIPSVRTVAQRGPNITGVGVLNFPDEWPRMFEETQTAFHVQSCDWAADYYRPFFGDRLRVWAVGIDSDTCAPRPAVAKEFDFLIYDKIRWPHELPEPGLPAAVRETLTRRGLTFTEIRYGHYPKGRENSYHAMLGRCRAMLFLCENETQGIAYNEALSMDVPMLAWNPGRWLDPQRHLHGLSQCPASSVPYWDERCGEQFRDLAAFAPALDRFLEQQRRGTYRPRDYVLENFDLKKQAQKYLDFALEALETNR